MRSSCSSERIYKWTLPAYQGQLPDGHRYNACPTAEVMVCGGVSVERRRLSVSGAAIGSLTLTGGAHSLLA
ncbi:hypothetical protein ACFRQM_46720 [Streptomyces sp. NPDC056831]|uniref:GP88 family protein n=1 Tax=Streptomyces sp. NPDC056831 TaxID=3345954 RepID=UPI0036B378FF